MMVTNLSDSPVQQHHKEMESLTYKSDRANPDSSYLLFLELRKKILTFRDIFDMPPLSASVPIHEPEFVPCLPTEKLKERSTHQALICFYEVLKCIGDSSSIEDSKVRDEFKTGDVEKVPLDELAKIMVTLLDCINSAEKEKFDVMKANEQPKKGFSRSISFGRLPLDQSPRSEKYDGYPAYPLPRKPTSDLPESPMFEHGSYAPPRLSSLRVQAVEKLRPMGWDHLSYQMVVRNSLQKQSKVEETKTTVISKTVVQEPSALISEEESVDSKSNDAKIVQHPMVIADNMRKQNKVEETKTTVIPKTVIQEPSALIIEEGSVDSKSNEAKTAQHPMVISDSIRKQNKVEEVKATVIPTAVQEPSALIIEQECVDSKSNDAKIVQPPPIQAQAQAQLESTLSSPPTPLPHPPSIVESTLPASLPIKPIQPRPPPKLGTTPPPPPSPGGGASLPPPPPIGLKGRNFAPPPPMPMGKGGGLPPPLPRGAPRSLPTKMTTTLKRSPNIGNLYRNLKRKMEGSTVTGKTSQGKKFGGSGGGGGASKGQSMADALAEMTKKSTFFKQVEEDVEKHGQSIKEMQAALSSFKNKDMDELFNFHKQVESKLGILTDENQMIARFENFPLKKLEALRMAGSMYNRLNGKLTDLRDWKFESPLEQHLEKIERYITKIKKELEDLEQTKPKDAEMLQSQNIHFDFHVLVKIKEAAVNVASRCMELAIKERSALKATSHDQADKIARQTKMLWRVFQLAYKIYMFAGGQDEKAESLTRALAQEIESDPTAQK